jgi:uncharacterized protein YqeY
MTLREQIQNDLKASMKAKTATKTSALRVLIGEFQRQPKKDISDKEVLGIIRKLIKSETETLAKSGETSSEYLEVLEAYMPKQPSDAEIREWIAANVDFSQFKNKMQAMKPIMAHFGSMTDGNMVKKILAEM